MLDLVNTISCMIDKLTTFAAEVKKVAREVGTEEKLGGQAEVGNGEGLVLKPCWKCYQVHAVEGQLNLDHFNIIPSF